MTYDLLMLMFDDPHAEEVEHYLTSKQIKVVREHTVKKAIQCIRYNSYHFVLLDQRLEGADFLMDIVYQGYYGICTYLIAAGEFRHAEERAAVLRSGADVCICAPVSPDELYEQISAVTRRQHRQMRHSLAGPSSLPILKFTNLSIDPIRNAVMSSGREMCCICWRPMQGTYVRPNISTKTYGKPPSSIPAPVSPTVSPHSGDAWAVTQDILKRSTGGDTASLTFWKKDVDNFQSFS